LYFNCLSFIRISEFYDKRYVTYLEKTEDDIKIKLFCLDPSNLLREALKRGTATICFSATLAPILYFRDILGGGKEDYMLRLASPFDKGKMCLMLADNISTKYKNRMASLMKIVELIYSMILQKKGNYLVFFPSYQYMNLVHEMFIKKYIEINTIVQSKEMSEDERDKYLQNFSPVSEDIFVGFAVLGGIFSEGIDLTGERLSGAVIVGVGLPMMCEERDIIRKYFEKSISCGYEYAYMYPGMSKVLQSSGRVIRSENDIGAVLLIDERFSQRSYQKLFPKEWFPYSKVKNPQEIVGILNDFWKNSKLL
jgi:DNA excision repair protein ERCC-2